MEPATDVWTTTLLSSTVARHLPPLEETQLDSRIVNTVYEYVVVPTTGTVHLIRQADTLFLGGSGMTVCGRSTLDMMQGDETISGNAATCNTCRRITTERVRP